jgi:tetratricopeptide (TPR) repeat protein
MTPIRLLSVTSLTALLAACGSKPVAPPPVVSDSQTFMASGMAAYNDNRYTEARSFFGRAFMEYRSVDDLEHEADALMDLADAGLQQGDLGAARDQIKQARAVLASHPQPEVAARLTLLEASADLLDKDPGSAATALDGLLNDASAPSDIKRAALFARAQAAFDAKAPDASQWLAKIGGPQGDLEQGRLDRLQALADSGKATALYADALQHYQTAYYRPGIAAVHEEWGALLMSQQDWKGARDHLQRALNIRLWMNDATRSARIFDALQQVDTALGDSATAAEDAKWSDYLKNGGDTTKTPYSGSSNKVK